MFLFLQGSSTPFSQEVADEHQQNDKGEITRQVEEDLSLLNEREAQHIEEAKALKEKLSKVIKKSNCFYVFLCPAVGS